MTILIIFFEKNIDPLDLISESNHIMEDNQMLIL